MIRLNPHFQKLQASYLFSTVTQKVQAYQTKHPEAAIIRMGIGDVTRALPTAVTEAFHAGVRDLESDARFKGYGPEQGYDFLRQRIAEIDFVSRGCPISKDDIFVSDGAKCDTANFQELFAQDLRIGVPDPVYPVYVDTNVMAGRTGTFSNGRYEGLFYLESNAANGFVPTPPDFPLDLVYLCFPNNPTGATATKSQLADWVAYAKKHRALILFDAAYEAFIRDPALPRSIYEIDGAQEVAVEFRSLSKTAGFTGTRLAFTVIPKTCRIWDENGQSHELAALWNRRQTTKFNGVSYPVQKAAEAVYSVQGLAECRTLVDYYLENAKLIKEAFLAMGYTATGGENSPYVWVQTGADSWEFFDTLLEKAAVVCTPGSGFGMCGQGFARFSAFNHREKIQAGIIRLKTIAKAL
jgi:LL-diaminopimelate aminotransferase